MCWGFGWNRLSIAPNVLMSYHCTYYKTNDMIEKDLKNSQAEGTRAEVVRKLEEELFGLYKDSEFSWIKPPQLEKRVGHTTLDADCSFNYYYLRR